MPESNVSTADRQLLADVDDNQDEALVEEELLVEDVSIDGMCGVY
ncbi:MAG: hypothetical protein QOG64_1060 [Acidimicrobiaceae bacterium]|jgi:mycofactocin precursor|nr:hypothetical protein [Acidimicrobiaceae bacterium]